MPFDICIREKTDEICGKAREIGWQDPEEYKAKFLEAADWGELKRKINDYREEAEIIVFEGGSEKLNRKAASDPRVDIILHPGRGKDDSGIDKVIAEKAAENDVTIGFSLRDILGENSEGKYRVLSSWREAMETCEKYDVRYIFTTAASKEDHLRSPRDISALVDSLGYKGKQAVELHEEILERNREKMADEHVRGGVKKK